MLELPGLFLCLRGGGGGGKKIAGMWLARGWSGDYPGSHYGIIK